MINAGQTTVCCRCIIFSVVALIESLQHPYSAEKNWCLADWQHHASVSLSLALPVICQAYAYVRMMSEQM